jgi:hypothetical protein
MKYTEISICSSVLVVIGYIPEFYFIINKIENKNYSNIIWIIWCSSSFLSVLYAGLNEEYFIFANSFIIFALNSCMFLLKLRYNKSENISSTVVLNNSTAEIRSDVGADDSIKF